MSLRPFCGGDAAKWPRRYLKELNGIFRIVDTFDDVLHAIVIPIQRGLTCWPSHEKSEIKINRNQPCRRSCANRYRGIQIFGFQRRVLAVEQCSARITGRRNEVGRLLAVVYSDRPGDGDHLMWQLGSGNRYKTGSVSDLSIEQ